MADDSSLDDELFADENNIPVEDENVHNFN